MPSGRRFLHLISFVVSSIYRKIHTLDIGDALVKNLLESPGILELLLDLGNDALGKLLLLPLLDLSLITHPRIQNGLGLVCDGGLLLQLVRLSLKLGGFLHVYQP